MIFNFFKRNRATHAQRKISTCQTHDFNLNSKLQHAQRLISTSPKHDRQSISSDKQVSDRLNMGVFAVRGQGGSMVVRPAHTHKHHKEPHTSRISCGKSENGNVSVGIRGGKRPLDEGPLCFGSGEVSGIIGPPPFKRPADPSPKAHVDNKLRKQLIVKPVSTTFSATYVRQWACVAKFAPTHSRVNPTSWAGVLSVVFQRLKPLHHQMIKMF